MSVVLTCGQEHASAQPVHDILCRAGLASASPSRQEGMSAEQVTRAICDAYGSHRRSAADVEQLRPGRVAHALAADLMLANLTQADWGWTDPHLVHLLEYWRDYDPLFRFVLVYASPVQTVSTLVRQDEPASSLVADTLARWLTFNREVLRFYHANRDRALLVDSRAVFRRPSALIELVRQRWDVDSLVEQRVVVDRKADALADVIARSLLEDLGKGHVGKGLDVAELEATWAELESSADLPGMLRTSRWQVPAYDAWEQYLEGRKRQEEQVRRNAELVRRLEVWKAELAKQKAAALAAAKAAPKASDTRLEDKLKEAREENELLLLRLRQAQGELQTYFKKYQNLVKARAAADGGAVEASEKQKKKPGQAPGVAKTPSPQASAHVDFRRLIDGENWYYAEHDGRWAGPNRESSLRLPAMQAGQYRLEIAVVDAMAPDILYGMVVSLEGQPLKLRSSDGKLGPWGGLLRWWNKKQKYPVLLSAQVHIGPGEAGRALRLDFRFPRTISPATRGSDDMRELAVRVREVSLIPL